MSKPPKKDAAGIDEGSGYVDVAPNSAPQLGPQLNESSEKDTVVCIASASWHRNKIRCKISALLVWVFVCY